MPTRRTTKSAMLSKKEAAELAGVSPRTISRWLANEDVPLTKHVLQINRVSISRAELVALMSARVAP